MYYGDASHFGLVPNVPYAWQSKDDPILLPSIRGKSTSVFGLMNTLGDLVYDFFDKTINSEMLIVFFDRFAQTIVKKSETGYYYYGARYYNPRVSLWLSVDPLADYNPFYNSEHYIDGEHNEGIYKSGNLNPYIYCYNSPVMFTDPRETKLCKHITGR